MAPRMLTSLPFPAGPSLLRFHPRFSSTLLVGSASGLFTLADTQGMAMGGMHQARAGGANQPTPPIHPPTQLSTHTAHTNNTTHTTHARWMPRATPC